MHTAESPTFSGTLTVDDFVDANAWHFRKQRRRQYITTACIFIAGVAMMFTSWRPSGEFFVSIGLGGTIAFFSMHTFRLPRAWRKVFAQQKSFHQMFRYTWTIDGLLVATDLGQATRPWSHFSRVEESDRILMLYQSDAMFELIPKRWFANNDAMIAFRNEATRRIGEIRT